MSRGAGSRAISREEKRLQKEKERRIREANRMLIPVSKNTTSSMKLISFDPAGTFRFEGNRWVRVYKVVRERMEERGLGELATNLNAKVRFTKKIHVGGGELVYLTMTEIAETYDEVRTCFSEDEKKISQYIDITVLSIDEAMNTIMSVDSNNQKLFSYASMVRGRRDWKKECIKKISGESLFVMQYPISINGNILSKLSSMECDITVAIDIDSISVSNQVDFGRALEQRYNRHGLNDADFVNVSMTITFLCDSEDARVIIEKTILSILSSEGFIVSPCIGAQELVSESAMSLGIIPYSCMRNVKVEVLDQIKLWGGHTDGND